MDFIPHWATSCRCSLCGEIPDCAPLFHCPYKHQFCYSCFDHLRRSYIGNIKDGCTCTVCNVDAKFEKSKINSDFLRKLKCKPGIGRPYRYNTVPVAEVAHLEEEGGTSNTSFSPCITVEQLFRLPTDELKKLFDIKDKNTIKKVQEAAKKIDAYRQIFDANQDVPSIFLDSDQSLTTIITKKPVKCPHNPCNKVVAIASFVNHFKYEHSDIPKYSTERGKDLCLPCDVSMISHNRDYCLAMINVYEMTRINLHKSKSSESVIKTCNKFCQKVPVNTFWLMVSGSKDEDSMNSFAAYWLFANSSETYQCTIEVSSKNDNTSVSTFCNVNRAFENETLEELAESLNCLILSKGSFVGLLREGLQLNLRVKIH